MSLPIQIVIWLSTNLESACVRNDKQRLTLQDTYAATLATKVFRTAITAVFDLETRQYDVQNAFPHYDLGETIYRFCKPAYLERVYCF